MKFLDDPQIHERPGNRELQAKLLADLAGELQDDVRECAAITAVSSCLLLWSTHLTADSATARKAEVAAMQACAKGWSEARIIAGDYNMQSGSAEYNLATTGYTDVWVAAKSLNVATNYAGNCDGCTRNSRIDYIFTSKGATFLTLKSAEIVDTRDGSGVMPSDHKPMLVVYEVH